MYNRSVRSSEQHAHKTHTQTVIFIFTITRCSSSLSLSPSVACAELNDYLSFIPDGTFLEAHIYTIPKYKYFENSLSRARASIGVHLNWCGCFFVNLCLLVAAAATTVVASFYIWCDCAFVRRPKMCSGLVGGRARARAKEYIGYYGLMYTPASTLLRMKWKWWKKKVFLFCVRRCGVRVARVRNCCRIDRMQRAVLYINSLNSISIYLWGACCLRLSQFDNLYIL